MNELLYKGIKLTHLCVYYSLFSGELSVIKKKHVNDFYFCSVSVSRSSCVRMIYNVTRREGQTDVNWVEQRKENVVKRWGRTLFGVLGHRDAGENEERTCETFLQQLLPSNTNSWRVTTSNHKLVHLEDWDVTGLDPDSKILRYQPNPVFVRCNRKEAPPNKTAQCQIPQDPPRRSWSTTWEVRAFCQHENDLQNINQLVLMLWLIAAVCNN